MLIIPVLLIITFLIAILYKVKIYDCFVDGTKAALQLMLDLLPYLASIFIALHLMRYSGLSKLLSDTLAPALAVCGIPKELCELIILRPMSGSGTIALLETLYAKYGVDSYVARCASVIVGASDTILYIVAVYFSAAKDKRSGLAVPIALFATFVGSVFACFICRFI